MNAVLAGRSIKNGELFKCPVCGTILDEKPWRCPTCETVIDTYRTDLLNPGERPKVCVDLHGVVLDMLGALRVYLKERKGVDLDPESVTDYDFSCDIGFDRQYVFDAFKDAELYKLLRRYPNAHKAITCLLSRCDAHVYSSVVDNSGIIVSTNSFIRNSGLVGQAIVGKKPVVFDAKVLFDDNAAVHRQWYEAGFSGLQYIIDRPYNRPKRVEPVWSKTIRVGSFYEGVVDMFRRFGWYLPEVSDDA